MKDVRVDNAGIIEYIGTGKELEDRLRLIGAYKADSVEVVTNMAIDTIIALFKAMEKKDKKEIEKLSFKQKISFAKQCSEVYKALSGGAEVAVQVNNVITEEESKKFIHEYDSQINSDSEMVNRDKAKES